MSLIEVAPHLDSSIVIWAVTLLLYKVSSPGNAEFPIGNSGAWRDGRETKGGQEFRGKTKRHTHGWEKLGADLLCPWIWILICLNFFPGAVILDPEKHNLREKGCGTHSSRFRAAGVWGSWLYPIHDQEERAKLSACMLILSLPPLLYIVQDPLSREWSHHTNNKIKTIPHRHA